MSGPLSALSEITPYIYGTTRLGDEKIPREERVQLALTAMEAGVWFHTARMYGGALEILGEAFSRRPERIPELIIKIGGDTIPEFRASIAEALEPLGLESMQVAQLCIGANLSRELANGGDCIQELKAIRDQGLVRGYVQEVFPWTSENPLDVLKNGYAEAVVEAMIFYLNPLQRFAANPLWEEIVRRQFPVIAMRTVAGGPVHKLRDVPGFAWQDYLRERAVEVAPLFEESGISDWTRFCMRFAHSFPFVKATVGSSGKPEHLNAFLEAMEQREPLPLEIVERITALQRRWSDELDVRAEPWSM